MSLMPQSPTSVGTFYTCPKQYQAKYITKEIKFEPNAATERGSRWHSLLEHRMAEKVPLPNEVAHLEELISRIEKFTGEVLTEKSLAFDEYFRACDYKARYIGGNIDLAIIDHEKRRAFVFDYKTGKVKDNADFQFQLMVYAVAVFANYPHINMVRSAYIFLDHLQVTPKNNDGSYGCIYTREDLPTLYSEIKLKIDRIKSATEKDEWLPNPSGLCRPNPPHINGGKPWCQVKSCPFWNKR